jgi:hypothetical protein
MSLKKIVVKTDEVESKSLDLDMFQFKQEPSIKNLNFPELKKSSKYIDARHNVKKLVLSKEFEALVNEDLALYDATLNEYDAELVLHICNIAENYFIQYKKMGQIKKQAVIQVLKPYFKNDELLLASIVQYVFPQVMKSNIFRRNKKRLYKLFNSVVEFFLFK